ncbi:MAG: ABC transporter transmembrane domain-containing protein [Gammaproteobacteria bacterium]
MSPPDPTAHAAPAARRLRPLLSLWPFLRPYRARLAAALGALGLAAAAMLAMPIAIRQMIDRGFIAGGDIDRYFLWLLAIACVFAGFAGIRYHLVCWLGERVVADLRAAVYDRVIRMSPAFFETTRTGEVLSRLGADTTLVQSICGVGLSMTLRGLINFLGSMTMLIVTSPALASLILLLIPLVVLPLVLVGRRVRGLSRATQDRVADTGAVAAETLGAIETVQAFTLEGRQSERYASAVAGAFRAAVRGVRLRAALMAAGVMLVFGAIVLVLWIGAHAVVVGRMSGGQLGQFLLYAIFMAGAVASLSEMWNEIQRAAGAAERLAQLLALEPDIAAPLHPVPLPAPVLGRIRFEQVDFSYPSRPGERALDGFSLEIGAGETIALVGPSGAGKTTVFKLMLRFYAPGAGRITLDGVDLAAADPAAVRGCTGLVPQDTVLFALSAMENIRCGRPQASDAEVRAAARAAAADGFIERLPQGYDTFLGERGTRLSGGQRQRIAIARALLRDPAVLLLDEATSALDAESEQAVQSALAGLMRGRTTIVIAHRLATVLGAQRIVVMDGGRVAAIGTHAELLRDCTLYARLAALQFGGSGSAGPDAERAA